MSLGTFNHDIWQSRVREVQAVFRAFELFLSNEDAIAQHLDAQQEALPQLADLSRAAAEHYLTRAADLYRRQVIVVACTLLEAMIRDFFTALFVRHPMRMSNYVENHRKGEERHRILLKDVVTAESKEWLIEDLAKKCAAKIPEKKVVARLKDLAHTSLDSDFANDLEEIVDQRNRIVHEDSQEQISVARVDKVIQRLLDLTDHLSKAASGNDVPVMKFRNLLDMLRFRTEGTS